MIEVQLNNDKHNEQGVSVIIWLTTVYDQSVQVLLTNFATKHDAGLLNAGKGAEIMIYQQQCFVVSN